MNKPVKPFDYLLFGEVNNDNLSQYIEHNAKIGEDYSLLFFSHLLDVIDDRVLVSMQQKLSSCALFTNNIARIKADDFANNIIAKNVKISYAQYKNFFDYNIVVFINKHEPEDAIVEIAKYATANRVCVYGGIDSRSIESEIVVKNDYYISNEFKLMYADTSGFLDENDNFFAINTRTATIDNYFK